MFLRSASSLLLSLVSVALYARAQLPGQTVQFTTILSESATDTSCLTATQNADGAAVVIKACGQNATQLNSWVVPNGSNAVGPIQIFGDKCLDVTNGADADGTKMQIWTCAPGNTNQMWDPTGDFAVITWSGENKCLDVTNGNITNGNTIQIWDCDTSNNNQLWNPLAVTQPNTRTIAFKVNPNLCVTASANAVGAPVVIDNCDGGAAQAWSDPLGAGQLAVFDNLCITPLNDEINDDGTKLVLEPCDATTEDQTWGLGEFINLEASPKMVLDLTDGNQTAGNQLQIWFGNVFTGLTPNTNQEWVVN